MSRPRRCLRCGTSLARDAIESLCSTCRGVPQRGRPPKPLDPDASHAARLGAELRARRNAQGLTLNALAALIGFSPQRISEIELGKSPASRPFVAACDVALEAQGILLELFPAVVYEQAHRRTERAAARRSGNPAPLSWPYSGEAEKDVDPLNRRNLMGAGIGAALGLGATTAPAVARDIDPGLVEHWMGLMQLLDRHGGVFGPHEVLVTVRRELGLIAQHRQTAGGELRTQLLRVESRWSQFAGWLSGDAGDGHHRNAWADRAQRLAYESDYPEMVAYVLLRRCRWAIDGNDARRATAFAEAAREVRNTTPGMRALCALKLAQGHALAGNNASCASSLRDADALLNESGEPRPDSLGVVTRHEVSWPYVKADIARCRLWLRPTGAVSAFEDVLRIWPSGRTRDRGVQQARLALACAAAGDADRAAAEGIKAVRIARTTKSDVTLRELMQLDHRIAASDAPGAKDFHEAFATLCSV